MKKVISILICISLLVSMGMISTFAADDVAYEITNPYESVTNLLGDDSNHYKTNLHTHSTLSDGDVDFSDMIKEHYKQGYDVLAMTDHGVIGRYWNKPQAKLPLYTYQYIIGNKTTILTDEEYEGITDGTYPFEEGKRVQGRGMLCVPQGIELNMLTLSKSHVNGFFCDFGENDIGFENGFEYAVKNVEKAGGISFINHPGDWLESREYVERATDIKYVRLFGDIFNKYKTCQGMEILNSHDSVTQKDRILWDSLLQYVIPRGERNIWGFGNSDAHDFNEMNTSHMDFIMTENTLENVKKTMCEGNFFAIGRRARPELGMDFVGEGAYPQVTSITVNDDNDTIKVTAKNSSKIEWIANGKILKVSEEKNENGEIISTITLAEHSDDITCYVRFQAIGDGGICFSQAFVCDDGNMGRFIIKDDRSESQIFFDNFIFKLKSIRFFVLFEELFKLIKK